MSALGYCNVRAPLPYEPSRSGEPNHKATIAMMQPLSVGDFTPPSLKLSTPKRPRLLKAARVAPGRRHTHWKVESPHFQTACGEIPHMPSPPGDRHHSLRSQWLRHEPCRHARGSPHVINSRSKISFSAQGQGNHSVSASSTACSDRIR